MYHDHGDTLAWQYTGSALVNRVETYRRTKASQWSSHSRDLLENIRRFYNNSMLDADKQAAINLFLGVDPSPPAYPANRPHYRQWYNPKHLEEPQHRVLEPTNDVFKEYYKPHILSQLDRLYAYTMNSTSRLHRARPHELVSPFESRLPSEMSDGPPVGPPRRVARRWLNAPEPTTQTQGVDDGAPRDPPHAIETLVRNLVEPPMADIEQRAQEYDWYTHYHADELISSRTIAEEKDLQLYIKAAQLAYGDDVEQVLDGEGGTPSWTMVYPEGREERGEEMVVVSKGNAQLYEKWLEA